jgi:CRISPR/Cas system CSM-associated protein Csm3 (group 7 of RAMP superfamily)
VVAVRFEITFHTPFRVASGRASDGSDTAVDRNALLPASSLKGLMLSAARDLIQLPLTQMEHVFGTRWQPSPWGWSDAALAGGPAEIRTRARIRIESGTGTVASGALLIADEVHVARAEFRIDRTGWIEPAEADEHEVVLLAAARAVTAVGGNRRRGLGWVTVTPVEPEWTPAHLHAATGLVRAAAAARLAESAPGEENAGA